ncbi:hypothetical protein O7632_12320 [Solwaraspora sp. WMMD406]|uniref:hypothetical protein n=1 Tax=Solwaraspora sp. WMMD406 TaxID=3016095 RepID=UPI002416FC44|nr:hypothetical protein [Solwaraspora sp. WMMD406]MDG4764878.1 hypothetical protein [Solwaraspora sp. WMMD406]
MTQGWTRTSRLVGVAEIAEPMRYAVEEHCAGQLMGELAGASACCLTRSSGPVPWADGAIAARHDRVDILFARHLVIAGDGWPGGYARSARLADLTLAPAEHTGDHGDDIGVLVTARWSAHRLAESCWLGFGAEAEARAFVSLLRSAVRRLTQATADPPGHASALRPNCPA